MIKKHSKFLFFLCLITSMLCGSKVLAQPAVIKATIDSTQILIGQQTRIHLEVAAPDLNPIQLPIFETGDTLMRGVEVLERSAIDTVDIGNDRIQIKYDYLVTSFDSALYLLPPFEVIIDQDTSKSNVLALKVSTYPVDVESEEFFDIKNVMEPEFVWKDYINYVIYPLLILAAIALIVYLIFRIRNKKSILPFKKEEPQLPPHIIAINELDEIKSKKLWQSGRIKEYHSDLTDTMRNYLENRFGISAMEMTSGEILDNSKKISEIDNVRDKLKQMLLLADLVKFAKYNPLPDENELSMMNAYLFVDNTKEEASNESENAENKEIHENEESIDEN